MLVENVYWGPQTDGATAGTVTLSGTIRGKALNTDRFSPYPRLGRFPDLLRASATTLGAKAEGRRNGLRWTFA